MPEHEPQVGQADRSISASPSSSTSSLADAVIAVIRSVGGVRDAVDDDRLAGLHRPAGDEHGRDVQPHARRSACPGVILSQLEMHTSASAQCALTMYSTAVGDDLADGQRVEHAAVAHRDAVVDGDRVELARRRRRPRATALGDDVADVLAGARGRARTGCRSWRSRRSACRSRRRSCRWRARARGRRPCCGRGWWCGNGAAARRPPASDSGAWPARRIRLPARRPGRPRCRRRRRARLAAAAVLAGVGPVRPPLISASAGRCRGADRSAGSCSPVAVEHRADPGPLGHPQRADVASSASTWRPNRVRATRPSASAVVRSRSTSTRSAPSRHQRRRRPARAPTNGERGRGASANSSGIEHRGRRQCGTRAAVGTCAVAWSPAPIVPCPRCGTRIPQS